MTDRYVALLPPATPVAPSTAENAPAALDGADVPDGVNVLDGVHVPDGADAPVENGPDTTGGPLAGAAPPGVDGDEFRLALLEDTYEVVADLEFVIPAVPAEAAGITWPGTVLVSATTPRALFAELHRLGAGEAAIVAPDAPDLPGLLIGKLFRALGRAPAAVCPATGGGLVALAVHLPLAGWLDEALDGCGLDTPDAAERLRSAAPRPGMVRTGPGWHRLRAPGDIALLDPGLEGWENTRRLLSVHPHL